MTQAAQMQESWRRGLLPDVFRDGMTRAQVALAPAVVEQEPLRLSTSRHSPGVLCFPGEIAKPQEADDLGCNDYSRHVFHDADTSKLAEVSGSCFSNGIPTFCSPFPISWNLRRVFVAILSKLTVWGGMIFA